MIFTDKDGKSKQLTKSGPQTVYDLRQKTYTLTSDHAYEDSSKLVKAPDYEGREFYTTDYKIKDKLPDKAIIAKLIQNVRQCIAKDTYADERQLQYLPDVLLYHTKKDEIRLVLETPLLFSIDYAEKGDYSLINGFIVNLFASKLNLDQFVDQVTPELNELRSFEPFDDKQIIIKIFSTDEQKKQMIDAFQAQEAENEQNSFQNTVAVKPQSLNVKSEQAFTGNDLPLKDLFDIIVESERNNNKQKFVRLWNGHGYSDNKQKNELDLLKILVWWTNHDLSKVDTMFRQSKLMETRWNDAEYRNYLLRQADRAVSGGYYGHYELKPLTPAEYPHSMKEQFKILDQESVKWHAFHDQKDDRGRITKRAVMSSWDIGQILGAKCKLAAPYLRENDRTANSLPKMYYDWDKGLYRTSKIVFNRMIGHLEHAVTGDLARKKIMEDMIAHDVIKPRQLTKATHLELVPCGNGIYDCKTKKLLPYDPDKYCFTQQIATDFNPKATTEPSFGPNQWSLYKWLHDDVANGDEKLFLTLKQVMLAAVTGNTTTGKFVLFYDQGSGSTGKSTLLKTIMYIVGTANTGHIDFSANNINNMLFQAFGKQLLIYDDPGQAGDDLIRHTGILKKIVTNESIDLYSKYNDEFMSPMNAILLMAVNGQPHIAETTGALASRILPIEFKKRFNRNASASKEVQEYIQDKKLHEFVLYDLLTNVSLADGYALDKSIDEIMSESFSDHDPFVAFCEDVLTTWNVPYIPAQLMYNTYYNYAVSGHFASSNIITVREFYKKIVQKGWIKKHGRVPKAYTDQLPLSTDKDETPLATDYKTSDYLDDFKSFVDDMIQYNRAAGRLAAGIFLYTKINDFSDYTSFKNLPVTTLMINPSAKDRFDSYIKKFIQLKDRFYELEDYWKKNLWKGKPSNVEGDDINQALDIKSSTRVDAMHKAIVELEKYLLDNPDPKKQLTSNYSKIVKKSVNE